MYYIIFDVFSIKILYIISEFPINDILDIYAS